MQFGEITISQILLAAFSGLGIVILGFLVKKIFKLGSKNNVVRQRGNKVKGNMAAGDIIIGKDNVKIERPSEEMDIKQENNEVDGDFEKLRLSYEWEWLKERYKEVSY